MTDEEIHEYEVRNEARAYLYDDGTFRDCRDLILEVRRQRALIAAMEAERAQGTFCHTPECFCTDIEEF